MARDGVVKSQGPGWVELTNDAVTVIDLIQNRNPEASQMVVCKIADAIPTTDDGFIWPGRAMEQDFVIGAGATRLWAKVPEGGAVDFYVKHG